MSTADEHYPNVGHVRLRARRLWEARLRESLSVQERIGESVPWWLVLIAGVFFLLSVPHTMSTFNKITPIAGYAAPVGVEFGLLYAAFRRRQVRKLSMQLVTLEVLLFFTAVIVNGAGSFETVVRNTQDIQGMSFEDLIGQYRMLPATSQVALLLAPVAALIIPIGTAVAGEGLATLLLERQESGSVMEERWRVEGPEVEFEALRDAAIANGITAGRAVRWARTVLELDSPQASTSSTNVHVSMRPRTSTRAESGRPVDDASEQRERYGQLGNTSSGYSKRMDARSVIRVYLTQHPEMRDASLNQIVDNIRQEAGVKVGRSSVHNVLHEPVVFSGNGHKETSR